MTRKRRPRMSKDAATQSATRRNAGEEPNHWCRLCPPLAKEQAKLDPPPSRRQSPQSAAMLEHPRILNLWRETRPLHPFCRHPRQPNWSPTTSKGRPCWGFQIPNDLDLPVPRCAWRQQPNGHWKNSSYTHSSFPNHDPIDTSPERSMLLHLKSLPLPSFTCYILCALEWHISITVNAQKNVLIKS